MFKFSPARLGYLAMYIEPVSDLSSYDDIRNYFNSEEDVIAFPIESNGGVIGFISRETLSHKEIKQGIFKTPKIAELIESKASVRNAMESIYVTLKALEAGELTPIFLIYHAGKYIGISSVHELLIHSTRLQSNDLDQAKLVQEALMHIDETPPQFELSWFNQMAHEVGGDFLHFWRTSETTFMLGIFDMAGKGVSAALSTSLISSFFNTLDITNTFAKMNQAQIISSLHKLMRATISDQGFLASAFVFIDLTEQNIAIFNCGLGPIYIFNAQNDVKLITIEPDLPPLGFEEFPMDKIKCTKLKLMPQLKLFLSTDGLTDMKGQYGESFTDDKLKSFLVEHGQKSVKDLKDELVNFIHGFMGIAPQADDITFAILAGLA